MEREIGTLAEKAAAYTRGGDHLVKAIHGVLDILISILPDRFRFSSGCVVYVSNFASSNVGPYGPAICYARYHNRPVDSEWSEAAKQYYLHNDFDVSIKNATRKEIKAVGKHLPTFLRDLANHLGEGAEEMQKLSAVLDAMVEAAEKAQAER